MKKRFTGILAALALLVFMTPSLVAWGQRETTQLLSEDFSTITNGNSTSTSGSSTAWNGNGNFPTVSTAYQAGGAVRLGSGSKSGSITSKSLTVAAGTLTVAFDVKGWSSVEGSIKVTAGSENQTVSYTATMSGNFESKTVNFTVLDAGSMTVKLETTAKRAFLDNIIVTNEAGSTPTPPCADPEFSPVAGDYYTAQNVELSCTTQDATVHYSTTSNEGPWTEYSQAIPVSTTTTIWAYATATDYNPSSVVSATYNILPTTFNQDWEGNTNGWTFVSVTGEQVWSVASYQGNHYAKMSGYSGSNYANEDWCISPAFNLGDYTNPVLTFTTARSQHNGNELEVYFSNNYNGDPSAATWTQLTCTLPDQPSSGYSEFTSSGNISLSSYSGSNCYIGFKYTSTTSAAATWELDDIVLANQPITPTITLTPSSIDLGNNNATDVQISKIFTVSQSNLTEGIVLSASIGNLNTTTIAQGAEDTEITWTYTPTEAGNINATITATSGDVTQTLTINGAAVAPVTGDRYEMVTAAPQDWSGCYIITGTNSGNYYALTGVDSNLGTTAAVNVVGNSIESNSTTDGYQVIVAQTTNGYSLYMDGVGYLGYNSDATSGSNNLHALESFQANTCEWTIAMTDGLATITNVRNNGRTLQFNYNSGNSRFACYTSNQVKPTLFKYTGTVVLPPVINVTNNTISLEYDETEGSIAYTINNPVEGQNLTATTTADWISNISVVSDKVNFTTTVNEGNTDRTATITLSYTGATDKTVTVTQGRYVAPFEGGTYTLATSIESGKTYIIVGLKDGNAYAMGTQRDNNRGAVAISIGYNESIATVDPGVAAYEFFIESVGDVYSIYDARTPGYLYAASSTSNHLKTEAELDDDDNGLWAISLIDEVFSVVAVGDNTHNVMRFNYNNGSPLFACYASTSTTGTTVYLYEKVEPVEYTLEITGYTNDNEKTGYHLIASPVTVDLTTHDMTTGDFDLYYFDQSEDEEWRNYEADEFDNLEPCKGYLYAKKATHEGEVYNFNLVGYPYTGDGTIELTYTEGEGIDFPGLNLVGNPFANATTFTTYDTETGDVPELNFLTMNNTGDGFITTTTNSFTAAVMQGFFVQATGIAQQLQVGEVGGLKTANLNIQVSRNRGNVIDNAIVNFGNASMMDKYYLSNNTTRVYIPQNNREMAVVRSAAEAEMPVSFRASENGTYTLAVEAENVEMNYLHLIDNLTGMDVDLLQTPSYTFEAKTSDYASRFRLVFKANSTNENNAETFAYFNGTNWTVSNVGDATLQVVDVTGRTVANQLINGNAELNLNQPAGVYVIRLVNGDNVKTQKVVVR